MGLFIGAISFALIISFFCSLSEATVLSLTPGEVAKLSERHQRIGKVWNRLKSAIDQPIVVILVLNTIANTLGATVAGAEFDRIWKGEGIFYFSIALTFSILLFSEIIPKTIGVEYRKKLAIFMALPLDFLIKVLQPVIIITRFVSRPFTVSQKDEKPMALEELRALAAFARFSKEIGSYQEKIIQEASRLSQKTAGEIMIPAAEIIFFENNKPMEDLINKAHLDPHTRFPICEGKNINKILGYINFKELLFLAKNNPINPVISGIIRPVRFISQKIPLHRLIRIFIEEHIHIAIVQSGRGETLGLVTLEDIIEEFLGDIEDEFDRLPKMLHFLSGGTWMIGGGIWWSELAKRINKPLEPFQGTLSDWLLKNAEQPKPLRPGDRITHGDIDFVIRRMRRGRVFEVTLLPHGAIPPPHLPKRD